MSGHILVVEDESDARERLGSALRHAGYACTLAANAEGAFARVKSGTKFDLIIMDMALGGDQHCRALRLLSELRAADRHVPVVVTTANPDVQLVKFALNEGASYLIEKPFSANDLTAAVAKVLDDEPKPNVDPARLFARAGLTPKETAVAGHLIAGLSSGEIAELENNSPKTIRQHISQIYAKCEVSSRAEFFRMVYRP